MGTIFNYFPNKVALSKRIYRLVKQEEEVLFASFTDDQLLKTQIEGYDKSVIQFYPDNPQYFQFMEQPQASQIITEYNREAG